ncbi:MAG TPA: type II toxin-antitoxin system HicA family toxin [Candidatus Paceibacterota bacterium]
MSREKSNWTFRDVKKFLQSKGFALHHVRGSHHYFRGFVSGKLRMTHVQFHGSDSIHPKTLASIIKQSGISQDAWLE